MKGIIVTEYVTVTANQSSRLYNDMGLAVCESYLTRFLDPLKIVNRQKRQTIYRWSGFGGNRDKIDPKCRPTSTNLIYLPRSENIPFKEKGCKFTCGIFWDLLCLVLWWFQSCLLFCVKRSRCTMMADIIFSIRTCYIHITVTVYT